MCYQRKETSLYVLLHEKQYEQQQCVFKLNEKWQVTGTENHNKQILFETDVFR